MEALFRNHTFSSSVLHIHQPIPHHTSPQKSSQPLSFPCSNKSYKKHPSIYIAQTTAQTTPQSPGVRVRSTYYISIAVHFFNQHG